LLKIVVFLDDGVGGEKQRPLAFEQDSSARTFAGEVVDLKAHVVTGWACTPGCWA
jgi:hypothetical protein